MKEATRRRTRVVAKTLTLAGALAITTQAPGDVLLPLGSLITLMTALLLLMTAGSALSSDMERALVRQNRAFARHVLPVLLMLGAATLTAGAISAEILNKRWPASLGDPDAATFILFSLMWATACWLLRAAAEHSNALGWAPVSSPKFFGNLPSASRVFIAAALGWVPAALGGGIGADTVVQVVIPLLVLTLWRRAPRPWRPLIERDIEQSVRSAIATNAEHVVISAAGVANHELDPRVLQRRQAFDDWFANLWKRTGVARLSESATAAAHWLGTAKPVRHASGCLAAFVAAWLASIALMLTVTIVTVNDAGTRVLCGGALLSLVGLALRLVVGPEPQPTTSARVSAEIQRAAMREKLGDRATKRSPQADR